MDISTPRRVGAALFLLGTVAYGVTCYWFATRTYIPFDGPIVLRQGHVVTPEFTINVPGAYSFQIETDYGWNPGLGKCQFNSAQTRWSLLKDGKIIQRSKDSLYWDRPIEGTFFGGFATGSGRYQIDIDFPTDFSCMNAGHPRLNVAISVEDEEDSESWRVPGDWVPLITAGAGLVMVFLSISAPPRRLIGTEFESVAVSIAEAVPHAARAPGGLELHGWSPLQGLRTRRWAGFSVRPWERGSSIQFPVIVRNPAKALPTVSLVLGLFLSMFMLAWIVLTGLRQIPVGVMVQVMGPRTVVGSELAGETLSVWIDVQDLWYFNSKPTTHEELPRLLRERLARQASQVVYVDADDNADFNMVVRAIDIVRREHAQVILITTAESRGDAAKASRGKR